MSGAEIVECPSCNSMFEFEPAQRVDYTAKDDNGKTLSRQHAEHMSKFRVRCASCKENFCIGCKTSPYHINYTCEENKKKQQALSCRFCEEELNQPSISNDPAFQDVCRKAECIELMKNSCNKTHPCGHRCKGYAKERVCLPCLEPECIENWNMTHNKN